MIEQFGQFCVSAIIAFVAGVIFTWSLVQVTASSNQATREQDE